MKNEKALQDYLALKTEIDLLTEKLNEKKEEVVQILLQEKDKKAVVGDMSISLRTSVLYSYTENVVKQEKKYKEKEKVYSDMLKVDYEILKTMKKDEEVDGKAKIIKEIYTPVVSAVKKK